MAKRRFEFTEGTSDKFWELEVTGSSYTVWWGRRGTQGQSKTKELESEEKASKEADKLVGQKVSSGYVETTLGVAPAAVAPPKTAAPKSPKKEVPKPSQPPVLGSVQAAPTPPPAVPESNPAPCVVQLDPEDWHWATWRELPPIDPGPPESFDLQERLKRLERFKWSWAESWNNIRIPAAMSVGEATFWYVVMTSVDRSIEPKQLISKAKKADLGEAVTIERVKKDMAGKASAFVSERIWLPLANLLPADELVELLTDTRGHGATSELQIEAGGFRKHVVPRLTAEQKAKCRDRLRPHVLPGAWPSNPYAVPAAFHTASALGMGPELLAVVESWSQDLYSAKSGWDHTHYHRPQEVILGLGSADLVDRHMRRMKLKLTSPEYVRGWIAHLECRSLDYVAATIVDVVNKEEAASLAKELARVSSAGAAAPMLSVYHSSKAPQVAKEWLEGHPAQAIAGLVPLVEKGGKLGEAAASYLQSLVRRGMSDAIERSSAGLSESGLARLRATVLEAPGLHVAALTQESTPAWLRQGLADAPAGKPAAWVQPQDLPPILVDKSRLSDEQVELLLALLKGASLESPPAVCAELRRRADPKSLHGFAWTLFELWQGAGASSKEKWAFVALGLLGGDQTALALTPLIRAWPGESQHQRAVLGLDVLRSIGTHTALMQLSGIAQKLKFKALQQRAGEAMEGIAADMGLSKAELEDRVVPDCGLDDRGQRVFEFGPRRFAFALGPGMKPMVRDEAGALRPDLPKPSAKDDAELANASLDEWKLIKKQIREVTKIQMGRLEQAMVTGRRWTPPIFDELLLRHPLMTHVAKLVLWGGFGVDGALIRSFRITEEQDLADLEDNTITLDGSAAVGVVHPLLLSDEERAAWGGVFSDYEVIQPFPQLGRTIYRLGKGEEKNDALEQFHGLKLAAPSLVFPLEKMGWSRGTAQDAGCFDEHSKPFASAEVTAVLTYDGTVGMQYIEPGELLTVTGCYFVKGIRPPTGYVSKEKRMRLGDVDPIVLSEVLYDLTTMAKDKG